MIMGFAGGQELVNRIVDRVAELYTLPGAAIQLLRRLEDPAYEVDEIRKILETDPALVAKVLRVVNSAFFGLGTKVSSLGQALTLLGRSKLRLILLGFSLPDNLFVNIEKDLLTRYWRHTLTKAVAAREIAFFVDRKLAEECFLVGLLEDLGVLCLVRQLGQPYCRLVGLTWDAGASLMEVERQALGFSHRQVSAVLLSRWNFPEPIVAAIQARDHAGEVLASEPAEPTGTDKIWLAVTTVELAEVIVEERDRVGSFYSGVTGSEASSSAPEVNDISKGRKLALQSALGISDGQVDAIRALLDEKVHELAELLNIELLPPEKIAQLKEGSRRLLAQVAAEAAENLLQLELIGQNRDRHRAAGEKNEAKSSRPEEVSASKWGPGPALSSTREESLLLCPKSCDAPSSPSSPTKERQVGLARSRVALPQVATGGEDPGFLEFLRAAIVACRARRSPLSLLLVELLGVNDLLPLLGPDQVVDLWDQLKQLPAAFHIPPDWIRPYGEWGIAIVLLDHDRPAATELANQLSRWWNSNMAPEVTGLRLRVSLAQGIATAPLPSKNLRPELLLDRAERCLFGSRIHGGMVKSIEL